jgi:hypothetical protein
MTLDELLLQRLADWRPDSPRQPLNVTADGRSVCVVAEHADSVGCRLWEVALTGPPRADLAAAAATAAGRATGLLEPLRLVEADAAAGVALLRSQSPGLRGGARSYYEVRLGADGSAGVRRFQVSADGYRREQVAFSLTHEALAKLVADLA